jgi:hypothetical protein
MSEILHGVDRRPADVGGALVALETVAARLYERGDARAAFPEVYGLITRSVHDRIREDRGFFLEPSFISRLDGRFCERYLDTLAWSLSGARQDCAAWGIAYGYLARRSTTPFQDVVLGISAHINFDLAIGIHQTLVERGHQRDAQMLERVARDHDAVNGILQVAIPECFERLVERHGCRTAAALSGRAARAVTYPMVLRVLTAWRRQVWTDVLALCEAGPAAEAAVLARIARRSARLGRAIVAPNRVYARIWRPVLPAPARRAVARIWIRSRPAADLARAA